jgi:hypothetical protein
LPTVIFAIGLFAAVLDNRYAMAGIILVSKNEVPYYKAALFWGVINILLLFLFVKYLQIGIISLFLARVISSLYNSWKWPHLVNTELRIRWKDYRDILRTFVERSKK